MCVCVYVWGAVGRRRHTTGGEPHYILFLLYGSFFSFCSPCLPAESVWSGQREGLERVPAPLSTAHSLTATHEGSGSTPILQRQRQSIRLHSVRPIQQGHRMTGRIDYGLQYRGIDQRYYMFTAIACLIRRYLFRSFRSYMPCITKKDTIILLKASRHYLPRSKPSNNRIRPPSVF